MSKDNFEEEEMLREMNEALGKQISAELDEDLPNVQMDDEEGYSEEFYNETEEEEEVPRKRKISKKLVYSFIGGGVGLIVLVIATGYFFINNILGRITYEEKEHVQMAETDLTPEEKEQYEKEKQAATPIPFDDDIESAVINILLIGEEAIKDTQGRSDSMMIASINLQEKTFKLTSIMRDVYVKIPGYKDNKLNAAFNKGAGFLLTETIEENFAIKIDGFIRVGFDGFESIIDELGGVEVELTADEADYLNRKNYISKKKYRNVKPGVQVLNGNQALGYCRVRYRTASNGEKNDFGRTYRQRLVLNSVFKSFLDASVDKKIKVATSLLDYVKTNISRGTLLQYITQAATLGSTELQTFRIPVDGTYKEAHLPCGGSAKNYSVLVVDFEKNIGELRKFIYGEPYEASTVDESQYYMGTQQSNNYTGNSNSSSGTTSIVTPTQAPVVITPAPTRVPTPVPTKAPTQVPEVTESPEPTEPTESIEPEEPTDTIDPSTSEEPTETEVPDDDTMQPEETDIPEETEPVDTAVPETPTKEPITEPTQAPSDVPVDVPVETKAPTPPPVEVTEAPVVITEPPEEAVEQMVNGTETEMEPEQ